MGKKAGKKAEKAARKHADECADDHAADDPKAVVRELVKAGKVKKKCCKSTPRCKKCPVLALRKARADAADRAEAA